MGKNLAGIDGVFEDVKVLQEGFEIVSSESGDFQDS